MASPPASSLLSVWSGVSGEDVLSQLRSNTDSDDLEVATVVPRHAQGAHHTSAASPHQGARQRGQRTVAQLTH